MSGLVCRKGKSEWGQYLVGLAPSGNSLDLAWLGEGDGGLHLPASSGRAHGVRTAGSRAGDFTWVDANKPRQELGMAAHLVLKGGHDALDKNAKHLG